MKKILLSCVTCLLAIGLLAGCNNEEEEDTPNEPETTVPSTGGDDGDGNGETTYLFGFELDGTLQYIDGGLVEYNGAPQSNEGAYTDDVSKAAAISCEVSGSTYYLSFDNEGVTNWITIVSGDHPDLSYATEKSPIYLHTTDGGAEYFGDEEGDYFLSYNATYKCVYASSVTSWITSSPVCGLYTTDGKLVAGGVGEEPAPAIEPVLGTVTTGDYFLGITIDEVPYYFDGQVYNTNYAEVTKNGYEAVVVTVAEVSGGYTLSFEGEEGTTQYLNMVESGTYRNLKWGTEAYTWSYDTTYSVFVAADTSGDWYFIGTYGTYVELTLNAYGYLTGDKSTNNAQYPAELFDVITFVAPTSITVTTADGESSSVSVEVGRRITLTAEPILEGEGEMDPRFTWSSYNEAIATVSANGVVTGQAEGTAYIFATSVVDSSVYGYISIEVVAATTEVVTYKLGCLDSEEYTYWWFDGSSSGNFLTTSADWDNGVEVYIEAAEGDNACTLSFYDENSELKYISSGNSNTTITISEDSCTWIWSDTYGVFAMGTNLNTTGGDRFLGLNDSNTIGGYAGTSTNLETTYLKITAFESDTMPTYPSRPTLESITISGPTSVEVGETIHLTVTESPAYAVLNVEWSTSDESLATVDQDGVVEGIAVTTDASPVVITAKSTDNQSISDSYEITVKEFVEKVTETANFTALSSTKNGSSTLTGTKYEGLISCDIVWDDGTGNGSSNTLVSSDHIRIYSGETITFVPKGDHELVEITIMCASKYAKNTSVTDNLATATIEGDNIVITDFVDGTQSVTVKNADTAQIRITSISIVYE